MKKVFKHYECLGEKCPNNCCSNQFIGLSGALKSTNKSNFVQIMLSNSEVCKIKDKGRSDLIERKNGNYYLKLNQDFSCSALYNGICTIYNIRPDVCKLYPYYFDPFCGICIDKNCPGNFDLNIKKDDIYDLLTNRINLFNKPYHFFFDGYEIDNKILADQTIIMQFINEINTKINYGKSEIKLIPYFNGKIKEDGGIICVLLGSNFHFTCHTFCYKNTVFIDGYGDKIKESELLPIIQKHFKTKNYDLCKNNLCMQGNFGKHLIINCLQRIKYKEAIRLVQRILKSIKMTSIYELITNYTDDDVFDLLQPIAESHISIHQSQCKLTIDIFSCKYFEDKKVVSLFKNMDIDIICQGRGIMYK